MLHCSTGRFGPHDVFSSRHRVRGTRIALAGLIGVVAEIAGKDASLFGKMVRDVRGLAAPVQLRSFGPLHGTVSAPANSNETPNAKAA